jgi:hypothetical protein
MRRGAAWVDTASWLMLPPASETEIAVAPQGPALRAAIETVPPPPVPPPYPPLPPVPPGEEVTTLGGGPGWDGLGGLEMTPLLCHGPDPGDEAGGQELGPGVWLMEVELTGVGTIACVGGDVGGGDDV